MEKALVGEVTRLLAFWSGGDQCSFGELTPLVYRELRRLAAGYFRRERRHQTLQPMALVHEAYLRLVDQTAVEHHSPAPIFAIASNLMRPSLVNHAERHRAANRSFGAGVVDRERSARLPNHRKARVAHS